MQKHPLGELMEETLKRLREMVDVNSIVGETITTPDGVTLIPISKVTFGFTAGGSEFATKNKLQSEPMSFGGGSGAGVSIQPIAFVAVSNGVAKILPVEPPAVTPAGGIAGALPGLLENLPSILETLKKFIPTKKKDEDTNPDQYKDENYQ